MGEQVEDIETQLLLEGVFRACGYDFREYSTASIKRRIVARMKSEGLPTISSLQDKALHDRSCMDRLLLALTVNVTAMFRDPTFYLAFRQKVVPLLRTYPFIRIWHAGCSTGEEVYSMAILLQEEGIYDRCRIYATDVNEAAIATAKEGIFPLSGMQEYTANYLKAGGKRAFSDYYTAHYDSTLFNPALREKVAFCQHNLVTDRAFNEFNVILCRNVMIYFNKALQTRVQDLFHKSLCMFGVLGLGAKESLRFAPGEESYEAVDERERIYRRVR